MVTKCMVFLVFYFLDTNVVYVSNNCLSTNLFQFKTESTFNKNTNSLVFNKVNFSEKRNINKVKHKRYEIINMLWKKTKIFLDTASFDNSTTTRGNKVNNEQVMLFVQEPMRPFQIPRPQLNLKSTTPSSIEFYYFNEYFNKDTTMYKRKNKNHSKHKKSLESDMILSKIANAANKSTLMNIFIDKVKNLETKENKTKSHMQVKTVKNTTVEETNSNKNKNTSKCYSNCTTIPSDRVKFFDIYDSDTYSPYVIKTTKKSYLDKNEEIKDKSDLNGALLLGVDKKYRTLSVRRSRFAKKHTDSLKYKESLDDKVRNDHLTTSDVKVDTAKMEHTSTHTSTTKKQYNVSHNVGWSDYPFVAAYVYEPLRVRCDAAAISPHWLVAGAACLYRHHKDPKTDEPRRSAFVIYCSDNWRQPVRISYVRRSIIHPRFHPVEKTRRHLYNIGAIQVVNSMSNTCSNWSPVSLMSHQFTAEYNGTEATALGWGLDRFDVHTSHSLPKGALMMYENLMHSKSCPGNDYNKIKRKDREITKNIYCVSFPFEEGTDPVHGSLLLMEGKLIALYLQEEREVFGKQSAEYTCIWRLLPWILDVAREPEDLEFLLEI